MVKGVARKNKLFTNIDKTYPNQFNMTIWFWFMKMKL